MHNVLSFNLPVFPVQIMDSTGLFDTRKGHEEVNLDIVRAVTCLHPGPHAILYVVRIGRFTQEDEEVFTHLTEIFDKSLENYTIVVFTGGDELERSGKEIDEILIKAPDNLKRILKACNNRYVVFNNRATSKHPQVELLLRHVNMIHVQNGGMPYTCPKYFYISEAVEKEVKERTARAEQKILKEKRYVQELEARARQAEEDVAREKEELQKREQERLKEIMEKDEKRIAELESFKQELEIEMKKFKKGVSENQGKGWISFLVGIAAQVAVPAILSSFFSGSGVAAGTILSESNQIPLQHSHSPFGQIIRSHGLWQVELYGQELLRKMNEKK